MSTQSYYTGQKGFKALTDDAIARLHAAKQKRLDEMEAKRLAAEKARAQIQTASAQAAQESGQVYASPLYDPKSRIRQHLDKIGIKFDDYQKLSKFEKEQLVTPLLEEQWLEAVQRTPQLQQVPPSQLKAAKEQFFDHRRNIYEANYSALEREEGFTDTLKNVAAGGVSGLANLVDSVGQIAKPVFGNDNWFSNALTSGAEMAKTSAHNFQSDAEQDRDHALHNALSRNDYKTAGKVMANAPLSTLGGEAAGVVAGFGGYGKAVRGVAGLTKLSKAGKAGEAITAAAASAPAYSALVGGGETANLLSKRGIDLQTWEGISAVAFSAFGNAAVSLITPGNAESQLTKWFVKQNIPQNMSRQAAKEVVEKLQKAGGFFKAGTRLTGNVAKTGAKEYVEERGQETVTQLSNILVDDQGRIRDPRTITPEEWEYINKKGEAAGFMGAAVGGGVGVATNANRFGSQKMALEKQQAEARIAELNKKQEASKTALQERADRAKKIFDAEQARKQADLTAAKELLFDYDQTTDTWTKKQGLNAEQEQRANEILQEEAQLEAERIQREKDALDEANRIQQEAIQRQTELKEYGEYQNFAQNDNVRTVQNVKNQVKAIEDEIVAKASATDPNFDEASFRQAFSGNGLHNINWQVAQTRANSVNDEELTNKLAQTQNDLGALLADKKVSKVLQGREVGQDGLTLTADERNQLAEVLSIATGTQVAPADVGSTIGSVQLLPEFQGLETVLNRVKADDNGFVVNEIHKRVTKQKADADQAAAQLAQQQADAAEQARLQALQQAAQDAQMKLSNVTSSITESSVVLGNLMNTLDVDNSIRKQVDNLWQQGEYEHALDKFIAGLQHLSPTNSAGTALNLQNPQKAIPKAISFARFLKRSFEDARKTGNSWATSPPKIKVIPQQTSTTTNGKGNGVNSTPKNPSNANANQNAQPNQTGQQNASQVRNHHVLKINGVEGFTYALENWVSELVTGLHSYRAHKKVAEKVKIALDMVSHHQQVFGTLSTVVINGKNYAFGKVSEIFAGFGFPIVTTTEGSFVKFVDSLSPADLAKLHQEITDYLNVVGKPSSADTVATQYGRIVAYTMRSALNLAQQINAKNKKSGASRLRSFTGTTVAAADLNSALGSALQIAFEDGKLSTVLGSAKLFYKNGELGQRVVSRLEQLAIDNDVNIYTLTQDEMTARYGAGTKAVYDNNTGEIYVQQGLSFTDTIHAVVHEANHAYFNRVAFGYHNFIQARSTNPNAQSENFGLTHEDVATLDHIMQVYDTVRNSDAYSNPRYQLAMVDVNGKPMAYGVSFDKNSPDALAEFMSELMSSENFRRATAEAIAKHDRTSHKRGQSFVRRIISKIASVLGFKHKTDNDLVTKFIEDGMRMLDTVPYRMAGSTVSRMASTDEFVTRIVDDVNNGVQSYSLKYNTAIDDDHNTMGGGTAIRDLDTGLWSLVYYNRATNSFETKEDLTESDLIGEITKADLKIHKRNSRTAMSQHVDKQVERLHALYPTFARWVQKVRQFLSAYMDTKNVDNTINWVVNSLLRLEHNTQDRDALYTWVSRMIAAQHPNDPDKLVDFQRDIQRFRAEANNEFTEKGFDRKSMFDHMNEVRDWANKHGITTQKLSEYVYVLAAQQRAQDFRDNEGGINPYTGKPYRSAQGKISGFRIKPGMIRGINTEIVDEDGSIYLSNLDGKERQLVEELRTMWIAQNDTLLDIEYASGVLSTPQYLSMKGKFYAPLKSEHDIATAFIKFATGRSTEAKDPFTNYYEHAEARRAWALHQQELQLLLVAAQEHALGNVISVNQTHYVQKRDEIGYQWRAPNLQDGSAWVVYKDGIKHTLTINDPVMREIHQKAKSWEHKSQAWSMMAGITRALSAVRTALSPSYLPVAYSRDILTAMVNAQAAFRSIKDGQVVTDEEANHLAMKIAARSISSVGGILKGKWTGTRSWEYDVFKRVGGGLVMNARQDSEGYNRWFEQNLLQKSETTRQMAVNKAKAGVTKLMQISHATEDSVRFATFMEFLEMRAGRKFTSEQDLITFLQQNPKLREQAISGSKHITGNFEVKGNNVFFRSLFMFFNASMVGARSATHMFNPEHGSHAMKAMKLIAALSLASLAMMDAELGDDEDGKGKASRVSATENGICWGMFGCIQMPHETRFITAGMKAVYEISKGDISVGEGLSMFMRGVAQMGSPFAFGSLTGENGGAGLAMGLVPTILQLPVQLLTNQNSFGRDIVPEFAYDGSGRRIMNAMDWQKSKLSDPLWSRWMAMNANKMLGLDISSSQLDHTANFFLGSIYTTGRNIIRGMQNGEEAFDIFGKILGKGFTPQYDEFKLEQALKERIRTLKAGLSMGDSPNNMLRSADELKLDSRYATLIALEKEYEARKRARQFHGKSYAQLVRERQTAQMNGDLDVVLEANEGIDLMQAEGRKLAGDFLLKLDDLGEYFE